MGYSGRTDSCQLRRWRACERAELEAGDARQQTARRRPVDRLVLCVPQTLLEECDGLPVGGADRSLRVKRAQVTGRASGVSCTAGLGCSYSSYFYHA